jgi:hypothetical protein
MVLVELAERISELRQERHNYQLHGLADSRSVSAKVSRCFPPATTTDQWYLTHNPWCPTPRL